MNKVNIFIRGSNYKNNDLLFICRIQIMNKIYEQVFVILPYL